MLSEPTVTLVAIDAVSADGETFVIGVEVGTPFESGNAWACPLAVRGIHEHLRDQVGEDPLQSLCLALRLIACVLENFRKKGGQLLLGGEEFPLQAYFGDRPSLTSH